MEPLRDRSDEVLRALRRIMRAIDIQSRHIMRTAGLTGPQLIVLRTVAAATGPLTVGQLAERINLSQATVTPILDRLERKQLIRRSRGLDDKRKVFISLTPPGRRTLADAPTLLQKHFVSAFGQLGSEEQTRILEALQRVAAMMQAPPADNGALFDSVTVLTDDSAAEHSLL